MKPSANVFISYSRKDNVFVERLTHDLQKEGIGVWMDVEQIVPGANWQQELERGLEQASVLLYISSRNSIDSNWIKKEIAISLGKDRKVIPIVIDDVGAKNMPIELAEIQWVDFRQNYDKAFDSLKIGLIAIVGEGESIKAKPKKIKGYVFLSYAEEDSEFLAKLRLFLKDHRYAYWDFQESDADRQEKLKAMCQSDMCSCRAPFSSFWLSPGLHLLPGVLFGSLICQLRRFSAINVILIMLSRWNQKIGTIALI